MADTLREKLVALAASAHEGGYTDDAATITETMGLLDALAALVREHVPSFHAQRMLSPEAFAAVYSEDAITS